jgi:homogentisate 1,2-dioxygenase
MTPAQPSSGRSSASEVPHYRSAGELPRKRHARHPKPEGGLYAEELMGVEGFSSDSSLLYHRHLPTAITAAETVGEEPLALRPNLPLLPRHLRAHDLPHGTGAGASTGSGPLAARHLLFANDDVRVSYARSGAAGELYRNAIGDELLYVESGSATLESVFGALAVGPGDYVVIPTSTTHRLVPAAGEVLAVLVVEARGHVRPPHRYLSATGQFLEQAPFSERDLRAPTGPLLAEDGESTVLVRHRGGLTRYTYLHHPFDVVGWDGCLYPYAFSIHDFEPIVKRFHAPPPVHQTFEGPGFVVCSFCPRPFDFDPEAIAVPYNHANVDSDEVLFYVGGDFMSRKGAGIGLGSLSLHPAGFVHGPQPGSVEGAFGKPGTDELAVMIDTFAPLALGPAAALCEDNGYAWTWAKASGPPAG